MKQECLDFNKNITYMKFPVKNMFLNNGIVNLYNYLEEKEFDISYEIDKNFFEIEVSDERFFQILEGFFKDNKIVHQTDNDRWYFDEKKQDFVKDKKFNTKGGQKNDLRNGVYLYKNISEYGLSREEVEQMYLEFCDTTGLLPEIDKKTGKLKVPNKDGDVIVHISIDEAIKRFTEYFAKSDRLALDSKIHSFEDGQNSFHDLVKVPKNYTIDKWEALFYWFGVRVQRFYNFNYFIYPNSTNLKSLQLIKDYLSISDDKAEMVDKNGKVKEIGTNIDFFKQLSIDSITNSNFYISKSEEEFELKFFMYLFSYIYHIEESYKKANRKRKLSREKLFDAIADITFVIFTDDGTFKTSFDEYTKAYQLLKFFNILKQEEMFDYLAHMLMVFGMSVSGKEVNLTLKSFVKNILEFKCVREDYYNASFNILKNDSVGFGKKLFIFEDLYLNNIQKGEDVDLHQKSKIIGEGIGLFSASLKDKDLLFKLRGIKNHKQLISFFKDLKFATLKNDTVAKFNKEFIETMQEILNESSENWEIIRDYIAIYAIDKYRSATYAAKQGDK